MPRRCFQFLVDGPVEQFQWTDNSAARQLVAKQGIGKIRHLAGKLLWLQDLVLTKEVQVGQVATDLNCSDVGTKCLTQERLLFLMNQVATCDPDTCELIGMDEAEEVQRKRIARSQLTKLSKTIYRMVLITGLEPVVPQGVNAEESCSAVTNLEDSSNFYVWIFILLGVVLWSAMHFADSTQL